MTRSEAAKARPKRFGRRHTPETRAKIAAARRLKWLPEMDQALRDLVPSVGLMMAAERIGTCPVAARRRCRDLGIHVAGPRRIGGTPKIESTRAILRLLAEGITVRQVSERHGLSTGAIYSRIFYAAKLGITA